jgi:hypothetical protein
VCWQVRKLKAESRKPEAGSRKLKAEGSKPFGRELKVERLRVERLKG